jgi:hypothetical protein
MLRIYGSSMMSGMSHRVDLKSSRFLGFPPSFGGFSGGAYALFFRQIFRPRSTASQAASAMGFARSTGLSPGYGNVL